MSSDQTPEEMLQEQQQPDPQAESVRQLMEAGQAQIAEKMKPVIEQQVTISVGDELEFKGIPFFVAVINKTKDYI